MDVISELNYLIEGRLIEGGTGDSGADVGGEMALPQGCHDCRTAPTIEFIFAYIIY